VKRGACAGFAEVGVTDLLDTQADFVGQAAGLGQMARNETKRHSREPPAEEVNEERGADNGGHGADGKFARSDDRAGESIGEDDGDGSTQRGSRQQSAMVRAEDETHHMRHDQAT